MKWYLSLVFLFCAVVALTIYLLTGAGPDDPVRARGKTLSDATTRRSNDHLVSPVNQLETPSPKPIAAPGASPAGSTDDGVGSGDARKARLLATVEAADALIRTVGVGLRSSGFRILRNTDGEVEVVDIEPGRQAVTFWADDYLAHVEHNVDFQAGKSTRLRVTLNAGILPRGIVFDSSNDGPIAGVIVDFEGHVRTRTDANGRFVAPYTVSRSALDRITVSHEAYDRYTFERNPFADPNEIRLAMSRGPCTLVGRLHSVIGDSELTGDVFLRLFMDMGARRYELRREKRQETRMPFQFDGLNEGFYALEVSFPNSTRAMRRRDVTISPNQENVIEISVDGGAGLEGRLHARALNLASRKVDLINGDGLTIASMTTDKDGIFRLGNVDVGTYRVKVWVTDPWFNTEPFTITESDPMTLVEIDCDLRRFKK